MKEANRWFDLLKEKVKKTKSVNKMISVSNITNKYKKIVGASLCAVALLTSVHSNTVKANEYGQFNLQTIYHVYVDGQRIGAIDDQTHVERLVDNMIEDYKSSFKGLNLTIAENLNLIPEIVFTSNVNNNEIIDSLKSLLTIEAEAVALVVNGEEVSYVRTNDDYYDVIENLKLQYVTKDDLEAVRQANVDGKEIGEPKVGETVVLDVTLSKEVEKVKVTTNPKKVLSVDDAIKQLNLGTLEDDIYTVEPGDVLGTIANAHGLTLDEILSLNPSISEDSLLQIGDELNVTVYKPVVKVIVEEASKVKEEIPYQTETKDDSNMWRGDTRVQQSGQKGERVVSYSITRENGRTIHRQIVSENVTKEPVNRVVHRGTKVSASRGTGQLAWPTVGGYISSYQGMRWGRFHRGIDIARPTNRNILAADNGTVAFAGWSGGYGNKVIINHNNGIRTLYAHLASVDVRVGQTVGQGQKIGVMGATGNTTGVHLHFEVYQNGNLKNPMDFLRR